MDTLQLGLIERRERHRLGRRHRRRPWRVDTLRRRATVGFSGTERLGTPIFLVRAVWWIAGISDAKRFGMVAAYLLLRTVR